MEIDWMDMVYYQQQVQKLTRLLLPAKQTNLTVSECELLAWLYPGAGTERPRSAEPAQRHEKRSCQPLSEKPHGKKCHRKENSPRMSGVQNLFDRYRRGRTAKRLQNHIAALLRPVAKHRRRF